MASPSFIDAVLDGGLDFVAANFTRAIVCSTEPTTYAQAATTYKLVEYTISSGNFTKANGDTSGRKITLGALSGNSATAAGNGNFIAFTNGSNTLYGVIDGDGDAISNGQQVNMSAVDVWEIADPS